MHAGRSVLIPYWQIAAGSPFPDGNRRKGSNESKRKSASSRHPIINLLLAQHPIHARPPDSQPEGDFRGRDADTLEAGDLDSLSPGGWHTALIAPSRSVLAARPATISPSIAHRRCSCRAGRLGNLVQFAMTALLGNSAYSELEAPRTVLLHRRYSALV